MRKLPGLVALSVLLCGCLRHHGGSNTAGFIYVADTQNNRIVRMDSITGANWMALGAVAKCG